MDILVSFLRAGLDQGGIFRNGAFFGRHHLAYGANAYRNNYATFAEIRTKTITVQASNNKGDSKKAKLFITLKRSPEFFDNMKKFNEIREENERNAVKLQDGEKEAKK